MTEIRVVRKVRPKNLNFVYDAVSIHPVHPACVAGVLLHPCFSCDEARGRFETAPFLPRFSGQLAAEAICRCKEGTESQQKTHPKSGFWVCSGENYVPHARFGSQRVVTSIIAIAAAIVPCLFCQSSVAVGALTCCLFWLLFVGAALPQNTRASQQSTYAERPYGLEDRVNSEHHILSRAGAGQLLVSLQGVAQAGLRLQRRKSRRLRPSQGQARSELQ